ncbi:hypothetical protein dsx2_0884 [Desulfovibrio sp. X2]|uniref:hypothetical protein n=1 Tax=Desulfovibrio sp. X2 TaxID=941449 RepID=UPI0003587C45|nr:hypothetical protein [Desulfovibrio sp. X2]EPR37538.1 hypothetical protein dsx2_0884 [Desulfovibrio sp. X2]
MDLISCCRLNPAPGADAGTEWWRVSFRHGEMVRHVHVPLKGSSKSRDGRMREAIARGTRDMRYYQDLYSLPPRG